MPYVKILDGTNGGTEPIPGTTAGGLLVTPGANAVVDANNSSTTVLVAGNTTFTGTATDVLGYTSVSLMVMADKKVKGFLEWSTNGTNWDNAQEYDGTMVRSRIYINSPVRAQYVRVFVGKTEAGDATYTSIQTLLHRFQQGSEFHKRIPSFEEAGVDSEILLIGGTNDANTVDPLIVNAGAAAVNGLHAHNVAHTQYPVPIAGYGKAAAPTDVGADGRITNAWFLRNGSQAVTLTGSAGGIFPGDSTDGLTVNPRGTVTLGTTTYTEATSRAITIAALRRDADTTAVNTDNEFGPFQMNAAGQLKVEVFSGETLPVSGTVTASNTAGDIAHDTADSGNPVKIGGVAVAGGATPTSVAAGDRSRWIFNQHGIPYTIAGHPNLITREYDFGASAQTDVNLAAAAVAADERIYVTRFEALCDNANTVAVTVRAGFGTANVPAASATGVSGMIASHPGIAAGSGIICGAGAGIIAVGGLGEEPRLTSSAATTGNLHVIISYYLIDETP